MYIKSSVVAISTYYNKFEQSKIKRRVRRSLSTLKLFTAEHRILFTYCHLPVDSYNLLYRLL